MDLRIGFLFLAICATLAFAELPRSERDPVQLVLLGQKSFGKSKPLCKECDKLMTTLKKIVDNPEFEQALINNLKKVCNLQVFSNYKDICINLVNDVVVVIHELQAFLDDPHALCETLKFCDQEIPGLNLATKKFLIAISAKFIEDIKDPSTIGSNKVDTCDLCVSGINQLKKILETPEYMAKVENEIEKVCKYFGKYERDCREAVEYVFPKIIQNILDFLCQPMDVCTGFHLCKNQFDNNVPTPIRRTEIQIGPHLKRLLMNINAFQTNGFDFKCSACKTTIGTLLRYLKQDKIETEIANDLTNTACNLFPKELQDGCFDFMGLYAKASVVFTLDEWTAEDICVALHTCKNNTMNQMQLLTTSQNGAVVCKACQFLTQEIAAELEKPEVQQDIITFFTQGCLLLPGKWGYKCGDLVIQWVPFALGYIVDFLHRADACNVLHLC